MQVQNRSEFEDKARAIMLNNQDQPNAIVQLVVLCCFNRVKTNWDKSRAEEVQAITKYVETHFHPDHIVNIWNFIKGIKNK